MNQANNVETSQENNIKTIGILTSGGDAPGMNGVIRSVTRTAINYGIKVIGIRRGYYGLLRGDVVELDARSVSDKSRVGGTFLMTARSQTFATAEGLQQACKMAQVFDLNALVTIGGDGTMRGAGDLAKLNVPVIHIPATIDNDVGCTDYTIGFDSALNTAINCVDKLRDTASSHERCSVIEVMGRKAGYLALHVGIATGAEIILIPEQPFDRDRDIIGKILLSRNRGKQHYIVVVAEGAAGGEEIAQYIETNTGTEARATVLGYLQRGGSPTYQDRYLASMFGIQAVKALVENRVNRVIVMQQGKVTDLDLFEGLEIKKTIDADNVKKANMLSI
ncbi:MAG: 6-phosphofructokinase [Clostridiaceae bacterium]|nr:6-phosphofructokinase [Clostridiaceae bacterium]